MEERGSARCEGEGEERGGEHGDTRQESSAAEVLDELRVGGLHRKKDRGQQREHRERQQSDRERERGEPGIDEAGDEVAMVELDHSPRASAPMEMPRRSGVRRLAMAKSLPQRRCARSSAVS